MQKITPTQTTNTWIIGDIQGCYNGMMRVLEQVGFEPERDCLWSVGDLVNRGEQSLEVLRFCHSLGKRFVCTLGNHDLHLLAVARGCSYARKSDTFGDILQAPDKEMLLDWLQQQPLAYYDKGRNLLLSHAGIAPMWNLQQVLSFNQEIQEILQDNEQSKHYFSTMYGNDPNCWSDDLICEVRWRTMTNYFTRMRFINSKNELNMDLKERPQSATTSNWSPWFHWPHHILDNCNITLVIGHWAALNGISNHPKVQALDTGYVWGGSMTLLNADTLERVSYQHV